MKRKHQVIFTLIALILFLNHNIEATTGKLKSATLSWCNGTQYGKHTDHWHISGNANGYATPTLGQWSSEKAIKKYLGCASTSASTSKPKEDKPKQEQTIVEPAKSSDTRIDYVKYLQTNRFKDSAKKIICEQENCEIEFINNMILLSPYEKVNISIALKDEKAQLLDYDIDTESNNLYHLLLDLNHGENKIPLKVKAENGKIETYSLTIDVKDNNTNLSSDYKINNEQIHGFDNYSTEASTAIIELEPESKTSQIQYVDTKNEVDLEIGQNEINVIVTSEFGDQKTQNINIERLPSSNNKAKFYIDGKEIDFSNCTSNDHGTTCLSPTITVLPELKSSEQLNLEVILENESASYEVYHHRLKREKNEISIDVSAQNGDVNQYVLELYKEKPELKNSEIAITSLLSFLFLGNGAIIINKRRH